jgi:hypothetical protein
MSVGSWENVQQAVSLLRSPQWVNEQDHQQAASLLYICGFSLIAVGRPVKRLHH